MPQTDEHSRAKKAAALKALEWVQSGQHIGLGTGTTAFYVIEGLARKVKEGYSIKVMASSVASARIATEHGIEVSDQLDHLDITIDGADEVDHQWNLIKGGGGALLREKILAFNSAKLIIVVDSSKHVGRLGRFPLPVEVTPFGHVFAAEHLRQLGCTPVLRQKDGEAFITDNGNFIIDTHWKELPEIQELNIALHSIPGIVETGLFAGSMVHQVITGFNDGHTEEGMARKTL